jgi:hypothetical protein
MTVRRVGEGRQRRGGVRVEILLIREFRDEKTKYFNEKDVRRAQ